MLGPLGPQECIVVAALALVIFGPKRLPEIGRSLGNALREFRRSVAGIMDGIAPAGGAARREVARDELGPGLASEVPESAGSGEGSPGTPNGDTDEPR